VVLVGEVKQVHELHTGNPLVPRGDFLTSLHKLGRYSYLNKPRDINIKLGFYYRMKILNSVNTY